MTYGNYPDLKKVKKILVVKLRHHGDVLLTSPVFTHLKKAIPGVEIDAFIYQDTLPMLEGHPGISSFLFYDRKWKKLSFFQKLLKEFSLLWSIRKKSYDLVINLTEGDRGAIAAFISGSLYKVGFDPQGKGFFGKKKLYTHKVKHCSSPRHTVEKQLDVLRCMGLFPTTEERDLFLHVPISAEERVKKLLSEKNFSEKDYILIHPVSRWRFKCLPPHSIASLIVELQKRGRKIVITSGPDSQERDMVQEILALTSGADVLDLGGKISLKELGAAIQLSSMVICVDSVPLHMASALKTPVVALFGPSSDQNWGPWMHPKSRVVTQKVSCRPCFMDGCGGSKMSDCLHTLSVKSILTAVDSLEIPKNLIASSLPLYSSEISL